MNFCLLHMLWESLISFGKPDKENGVFDLINTYQPPNPPTRTIIKHETVKPNDDGSGEKESEPPQETKPEETPEQESQEGGSGVPAINGEDVVLEKPNTEKRTVLKTWDIGDPNVVLPDEVRVHLFQDGMWYAEGILNAANEWQCEFKDLPLGHYWSLSEVPVDGYESEIVSLNNHFHLINHYILEVPVEEPEYINQQDNHDTMPPSMPVEDVPLLPQTGLYWWPVALLGCGGMLCFTFGVVQRRKELVG